MTIPRVYSAIAAVTADFAGHGIAKTQANADEQYFYRGIDDVTCRLAPILAQHRLCILPRVLERSSCDRQGPGDTLLISVSLRVAFDIVCAEDGSCHTIEAFGEALDGGDKATAKAMTAAFKHAVVHAFCIPVRGTEDADATTHRLKRSPEVADPEQGWEQWAADIQDVVRSCESPEAVDRAQSTYGTLLRAASKRCPELFQMIGQAIQERRAALKPPATAKPVKERARRTTPAEKVPDKMAVDA